MFTCGADGLKSLLGLVPAGLVADLADGDDPFAPVVVHMTVCKAHLRPARAWLRSRMLPDDEVLVVSTEYLMGHWDQMVGSIGVPVWGAASIA